MTTPAPASRLDGLKTLFTALFLMIGGSLGVWREMASPPTHSVHIYFFGGTAIFGAVLLRPDPIFTVIQKAIVIAGETDLPFVGGRGRRASDRQDPPAAP